MSKSIESYRRKFFSNKIEKPDFINKMYEDYHSYLFEYAEAIIPTNIARIEISSNRVVFTTRDRGLSFIVPRNDRRIAPIAIIDFYEYEQQETEMVMELVKDSETIVDVGANIGWYSLNIAAAYRNVTVHAFEPIPETFSTLRENIALNQLGNISANNFGLSSEPGTFPFYYYPEGSGNASMRDLSGRKNVQVINCSLSTLDAYAEEKGLQVDFIKCDVEGAELLVFEGGHKTITRDLPIIFSEILRKWSAKFDYNPNKIFEFFASMGYQAFVASRGTLQPVKGMNERTLDTNFFFLHQLKHAKQIRKSTQVVRPALVSDPMERDAK